MENILRKVAQFSLIYNDENKSYYIINTITREISYNIDFEKVNTLMILDRLTFSQRCIQSAGNNLVKKIQ